MKVYEVEIKTVYNTIHLSVDSLDDISEILEQPYVVKYNYKIVENSSYKKITNSAKENNEYGGKVIKKIRTNSFDRYTK